MFQLENVRNDLDEQKATYTQSCLGALQIIPFLVLSDGTIRKISLHNTDFPTLKWRHIGIHIVVFVHHVGVSHDETSLQDWTR